MSNQLAQGSAIFIDINDESLAHIASSEIDAMIETLAQDMFLTRRSTLNILCIDNLEGKITTKLKEKVTKIPFVVFKESALIMKMP